ncbi:hypothetical protein L9F63_019342, partial [Diploptera punctata]
VTNRAVGLNKAPLPIRRRVVLHRGRTGVVLHRGRTFLIVTLLTPNILSDVSAHSWVRRGPPCYRGVVLHRGRTFLIGVVLHRGRTFLIVTLLTPNILNFNPRKLRIQHYMESESNHLQNVFCVNSMSKNIFIIDYLIQYDSTSKVKVGCIEEN